MEKKKAFLGQLLGGKIRGLKRIVSKNMGQNQEIELR